MIATIHAAEWLTRNEDILKRNHSLLPGVIKSEDTLPSFSEMTAGVEVHFVEPFEQTEPPQYFKLSVGTKAAFARLHGVSGGGKPSILSLLQLCPNLVTCAITDDKNNKSRSSVMASSSGRKISIADSMLSPAFASVRMRCTCKHKRQVQRSKDAGAGMDPGAFTSSSFGGSDSRDTALQKQVRRIKDLAAGKTASQWYIVCPAFMSSKQRRHLHVVAGDFCLRPHFSWKFSARLNYVFCILCVVC